MTLAILAVGCKKISTPNDASKELFGKWQYVSSSGGINGDGNQSLSSDFWIEYTEKGVYKTHVGSERTSKTDFTIEMKESIYSTELQTGIVYENNDYVTFEIVNDILTIWDQKYDGYSYQYVKK